MKIARDGVRLDSLCAIHRGLWTGALYVFIVPEDVVSEYDMEKEALRPSLRGKDIKPFGYRWSGFYVIYATSEYVPGFETRFPNVMKWLERHRIVLERRSAVFTWGRKWWELEDPLDPRIFEQPKILSPLFARYQSFAVDRMGEYYVLDSTVVIRRWLSEEEQEEYAANWKKINEPELNIEDFIESGKKAWAELGSTTDGLWYIVALLNSETLEFFFKQYSPRLIKRGRRPKKGRWFSYAPPHLNIVPIRIAEKEDRKEVIRLAKRISACMTKYLSLPPDSDEKAPLEGEIGFLVNSLNEVVFSIYGLSEKEKVIVQSFVYRKR